jgi:hypothetical protein
MERQIAKDAPFFQYVATVQRCKAVNDSLGITSCTPDTIDNLDPAIVAACIGLWNDRNTPARERGRSDYEDDA